MKSSTLESKTVRPGSLAPYATYYHADRHPTSAKQPKSGSPRAKRHFWPLVVVVLLVVAAGLFMHARADNTKTKPTAAKTPAVVAKTAPPKKVAAVTTSVNECAGNTLSQLALVSISQRHMWACDGNQSVYDSPVITGMEDLAADLTPTGTYHVYGKIRDTTLTGHDTTGSWSDPVSYWMPFLHNQYGSYGFHDATWRANSDFGNISPYSSDASHGCVELPLATAAWLFNWVQVGTTVTIES